MVYSTTIIEYWPKIVIAIVGVLVLGYVIEIISTAFETDLYKIPGPRLSRFTTLPLKLAVLSGRRTSYIHGLHQLYGPIVRIAPREVAAADIESYREVHKIGTQFRKSSWYQTQSPTQYNDETCGVFGVVDHRRASARRKLYQQAGTKAAVREWEPQIVRIVNLAMAKIKRDAKEKGKADVFKWFSMMTTDVLGELAFGESFHMVEKEQKPQLVKDIEMAMMVVGARQELAPIYLFLEWFPIPAFQYFMEVFDRLREKGYVAVENTKTTSRSGYKTLFSKMYPADGSQPFPDSLMADEASNLIIAGSDTTAAALTYLVYVVLSHSKVKAKLLEDIKTLPEKYTWDDLENLHYLNNVIQETLRMYPSVPGSLPRVAPSTGATIGGGYRVPGGTIVDTQAYTLHRNPIVFPDPEVFNPERWESPGQEMKEHWVPFGGSARVCLGQNVARCELLHAAMAFFCECPNADLADSATADSMIPVDFFSAKPAAGKLEIVIKQSY